MKLYEIIVEGYWKNKEIDAPFDRPELPTFVIMVNGKIWKKNGKPVIVKTHSTALKIADKITATKNVTTQVIPYKEK